MVPSLSRDRQKDRQEGFSSALRNGLLTSFSVPVAGAKAGSWSFFLGGDIGESRQHPARVQKKTDADDR
jgi:hypothetical protein